MLVYCKKWKILKSTLHTPIENILYSVTAILATKWSNRRYLLSISHSLRVVYLKIYSFISKKNSFIYIDEVMYMWTLMGVWSPEKKLYWHITENMTIILCKCIILR